MVSVQFRKNFTGLSFCGGWTRKRQTFSKHLFWEQPSKYCIPEFTAFLCACYWVDLEDVHWNKVATSTTCNFNNSWPLYLIFLNIINLCPNIWFIKNSKCQQFVFWKRSRQKTQIFHIFKGPLFRNGWLYWYECWRVLRDFCGLSKKCSFATFPEIQPK